MKVSHVNIRRALKAAASAGFTPIELRLSPGGEARIILRTGDAIESGASHQDVVDELDRHFAKPRF